MMHCFIILLCNLMTSQTNWHARRFNIDHHVFFSENFFGPMKNTKKQAACCFVMLLCRTRWPSTTKRTWVAWALRPPCWSQRRVPRPVKLRPKRGNSTWNGPTKTQRSNSVEMIEKQEVKWLKNLILFLIPQVPHVYIKKNVFILKRFIEHRNDLWQEGLASSVTPNNLGPGYGVSRKN